MTRPDPKSFTTLEAAQAEIARCYADLDRMDTGLDALCAGLGSIAEACKQRSAEIRETLAEIDGALK